MHYTHLGETSYYSPCTNALTKFLKKKTRSFKIAKMCTYAKGRKKSYTKNKNNNTVHILHMYCPLETHNDMKKIAHHKNIHTYIHRNTDFLY